MAQKHIVTKDSLLKMLQEADRFKQEEIIGRALVRLLDRQTRDEVATTTTLHDNLRGFSKPDARQGTLTAKFFIKHGILEQWQLDRWLKPWRGYPRICKYWRQLDEEAQRLARQRAQQEERRMAA